MPFDGATEDRLRGMVKHYATDHGGSITNINHTEENLKEYQILYDPRIVFPSRRTLQIL